MSVVDASALLGRLVDVVNITLGQPCNFTRLCLGGGGSQLVLQLQLEPGQLAEYIAIEHEPQPAGGRVGKQRDSASELGSAGVLEWSDM